MLEELAFYNKCHYPDYMTFRQVDWKSAISLSWQFFFLFNNTLFSSNFHSLVWEQDFWPNKHFPVQYTTNLVKKLNNKFLPWLLFKQHTLNSAHKSQKKGHVGEEEGCLPLPDASVLHRSDFQIAGLQKGVHPRRTKQNAFCPGWATLSQDATEDKVQGQGIPSWGSTQPMLR